MQKLERMPVPILPTMVGAATLSNVYNGMGFNLVRHITMWAGAIVLIFYIMKIIRYPKTFLGEYSKTVPASLYAGMTMLTMILGSYLFDFNQGFGKALWLAGLILHALHIIIFTLRNVVIARSKDTFVPSWFVTYNGILVSCVVGGDMNMNDILQYVVYYGIAIYAILIPIIIWRLMTHELKEGMYHTLAIVLAPCSLCVVGYLNVIENPNQTVIYILYACVLVSLLFVLIKLPKFFSFAFHPGFAGMTFPMAIGIVASTKMAGYLTGIGNEGLANVVTQISGIQIYVTTAIIGFVLFNFLKMLGKTKGDVSKNQKKAS